MMTDKEILNQIKINCNELINREKENYSHFETVEARALSDGMQVAYKNILDIIKAYES